MASSFVPDTVLLSVETTPSSGRCCIAAGWIKPLPIWEDSGSSPNPYKQGRAVETSRLVSALLRSATTSSRCMAVSLSSFLPRWTWMMELPRVSIIVPITRGYYNRPMWLPKAWIRVRSMPFWTEISTWLQSKASLKAPTKTCLLKFPSLIIPTKKRR